MTLVSKIHQIFIIYFAKQINNNKKNSSSVHLLFILDGETIFFNLKKYKGKTRFWKFNGDVNNSIQGMNQW